MAAVWSPCCDWANPVAWHRRDFNKLADFIVNCTFDSRDDSMSRSDHSLDLGNANFLCHSDGGTRECTCSAAGWIIEAVVEHDGRNLQLPIAMPDKFLAQPVSSFTAELIALDDAISFLHDIVSKV